jgi:hypothetical protein
MAERIRSTYAEQDIKAIGAEDQQGNSPTIQVLLVVDVLVRGNHQLESVRLRSHQQVAVRQLGPANRSKSPSH